MLNILKPYQVSAVSWYGEIRSLSRWTAATRCSRDCTPSAPAACVGKGLGESIQKLGFLPEAQNDMVFSIICEELGLFGAVSVILIFLFMIYRFMLIAGNAPDLLGLFWW